MNTTDTTQGDLDLVAALCALPESEPIEVDGIQFGGKTCQAKCTGLTVNVVQTVCVLAASCK
jgi:hypothetical protein